jgi:hypothetical protein
MLKVQPLTQVEHGSIYLLANFQVPQTFVGKYGVPPYCQSPALLVGLFVMSVMNKQGAIGRPQGSWAVSVQLLVLLPPFAAFPGWPLASTPARRSLELKSVAP